MRRYIPLPLLVLVSLVLAAPARSATTLEPVGDFAGPTFLTSYPTDPDRLLVVERAGTIKLVAGGASRRSST